MLKTLGRVHTGQQTGRACRALGGMLHEVERRVVGNPLGRKEKEVVQETSLRGSSGCRHRQGEGKGRGMEGNEE